MLISSTRNMRLWLGMQAVRFLHRGQQQPPAYRKHLTHPVIQDEHGKPVALLINEESYRKECR